MKHIRPLLIVMLALTALPHPGFGGGREAGNGGDGVVVGENVYLLDFVEAGVEEAPFFAADVKADAETTKILSANIPFADVETVELVARKLKEIERFEPLSSFAILEAIRSLSWRPVAPELVNIPDDDTTLEIKSLPGAQLVQLAVRTDKTIRINRDLWKRLTPAHRAGLIFHEVVYVFVSPIDKWNQCRVQESPKARSIVGYLFSVDMQLKSRQQFREFVYEVLPIQYRRYDYEFPVLYRPHGEGRLLEITLFEENPDSLQKFPYELHSNLTITFTRQVKVPRSRKVETVTQKYELSSGRSGFDPKKDWIPGAASEICGSEKTWSEILSVPTTKIESVKFNTPSASVNGLMYIREIGFGKYKNCAGSFSAQFELTSKQVYPKWVDLEGLDNPKFATRAACISAVTASLKKLKIEDLYRH